MRYMPRNDFRFVLDLVLTHDFVWHADPGLFAIVPSMHAGRRVNWGRHRHITLAVLAARFLGYGSDCGNRNSSWSGGSWSWSVPCTILYYMCGITASFLLLWYILTPVNDIPAKKKKKEEKKETISL